MSYLLRRLPHLLKPTVISPPSSVLPPLTQLFAGGEKGQKNKDTKMPPRDKPAEKSHETERNNINRPDPDQKRPSQDPAKKKNDK